jgi:hypothetical protein
MALNPKYSNTMVNAEADAVGNALDTGYIRVYDGSQPATADTAIGAQVAGVITANAITADASANATGTATWGRVLASNGTTVWFDGSAGTADANIILNTTAIVTGAEVSCSSLTFTVSKG